MIVQKLSNNAPSSLELAIRYYSIISCLNNLRLPRKQIELLAFTAVRGTISIGGAKETFSQMFGSSRASIGNMISRLHKKSLLVKDSSGRYVVHPELSLNFKDSLILQIYIENGEA